MARNAVKVCRPQRLVEPPREHGRITVIEPQQRVMAPVAKPGTVEEYEETVTTRTIKRRRVETPPSPIYSSEPSASAYGRVASVVFLWIVAFFMIILGSIAVLVGSTSGFLIVLISLAPLGAGYSINNQHHA